MRISDWSSDVCPSDLAQLFVKIQITQGYKAREQQAGFSATDKGFADRACGPVGGHEDNAPRKRHAIPAMLREQSRCKRIGKGTMRSEERRVGNEGVRTCRARWSPYHLQQNLTAKLIRYPNANTKRQYNTPKV